LSDFIHDVRMNPSPAWNPPPVTDPIRIAQIGLRGLVAPQHVAELQKNPNFRLVAAFDRRAGESELAPQIAPITSRGGKVYGDYHELLTDANVEAVCIAAPHHLHRQMSLEAFSSGKHVLVEKPMAVHPEDCRAMIESAAAVKKIGAVQMQHAGRSSMLMLRDKLRAGAIGKIRQVKVASLWSRDEKYYARSAWAGRKMIGPAWNLDGVMFNQACHHIAQAMILASSEEWPIPAPLDDIRAKLYRFHEAPTLEMEDTAFVTATVAGDQARFTLAATTCNAVDQVEIELIGEKGRATWDGAGKGIGRLFIQGQSVEEFNDDRGIFTGDSRVFNSFAAAIRTGVKPITDFAAVARLTDAIFACYQQADWKISKVPWSATRSLPQKIEQFLQTGEMPDF